MRRVAGGAAALAACALAVPAWAQEPGEPRQLAVERDVVDIAPHAGVAITAVTIDNRLGDVRIEGHDGAGVRILAIKRAEDHGALDRLKVSLVPDPAGPVRIETAIELGDELRPLRIDGVSVDLVVQIPRGARVVASTWNGGIELSGTDSGAELDTNEGDIAVEAVSGSIVAHSTRGAQRFRDVFGEVDAEGLLGDMTLSVVRGDRLSARVHRGVIVARRIRAREVVLRTTEGDIELHGDLVPGGTYRVHSYRGNVDVRVSEGTGFRLFASSRAGVVEVPRAIVAHRLQSRVVGTYGGGAEPAGIIIGSRLGNVRFSVLDSN